MSTGLMTAMEFKSRYTPELALDLTIEKYERLRDPCNWDELRIHWIRYITDSTCGLCKKYYEPGYCRDCPLDGCCGSGCLWRCMHDALRDGKGRDAFLETSGKLLKRLREVKEEEKTEHFETTRYINVYQEDDGVFYVSHNNWETEKEARRCAAYGLVATIPVRIAVDYKNRRWGYKVK